MEPCPKDLFAREVAEMEVATAERLMTFMQWSARLACLPDRDGRTDRRQLDRWPQLAHDIGADVPKMLADRCNEGVWDLRYALGEDLAMALIDAQDFHCFYSLEKGLLTEPAKTRLEAWFEEANDASLDEEAVETLERFIERFPIPEDLRLNVVNAPMSPFMLAVLASAATPRTLVKEEWPPSWAPTIDKLLVDKGAPSVEFQYLAERLDAEYDVPGVGPVFVSRHLGGDWRLVLEVWGRDDRELPVRSVRVGLLPGQPFESGHTTHWLVDLGWVLPAQRLADCNRPVTISFQNGTRLEIHEGAVQTEVAVDWIDEIRTAQFAMEAKGAKDHSRSKPRGLRFIALGRVLIDGTEREVFTDGKRVAIRLKRGEIRTGLQVNQDRFDIQVAVTARGKLAILKGYGRAEAGQIVRDERTTPGKHVLHWY